MRRLTRRTKLAPCGGELREVSQAYRKQSTSLPGNPAEIHLHRPRLLPRESRSPRADSHETTRSGGRETSARVTRSLVAGEKTQPDVLYEGQYRKAVKKAECPQTKSAVVIDGPDAGKLLHVCRDEKCPVHARVTRYQPTPQERASRAKELLAERVEKQTRVRILNAIRKKLPATLVAARLRDGRARLFRAAWP